MKNVRKNIGNICLIGALISFAIAMICLFNDIDSLFSVFCMIYAFGLILGIILRIGDFFKWRGRMLMQGMQEATAPSEPNPAYQTETSAKFCRHCGKALDKSFAFCPACGGKN